MIFGVIEGPGGKFQFYPAISCAAVPPSSPSGYYWVRASNGSAMSVYCDMTRSCGKDNLNMLKSQHINLILQQMSKCGVLGSRE